MCPAWAPEQLYVIGPDGKLIKNDWVTGLTSNKGSALFNGLLYTAETSAVAVIDVEKATIIKRIPVEGAQMLNDVAVDSKGIVYVTDTRGAKVYRIEGDKPTVYLENMPGANGLLVGKYRLICVDLHKLPESRCQQGKSQKLRTASKTDLTAL